MEAESSSSRCKHSRGHDTIQATTIPTALKQRRRLQHSQSQCIRIPDAGHASTPVPASTNYGNTSLSKRTQLAELDPIVDSTFVGRVTELALVKCHPRVLSGVWITRWTAQRRPGLNDLRSSISLISDILRVKETFLLYEARQHGKKLRMKSILMVIHVIKIMRQCIIPYFIMLLLITTVARTVSSSSGCSDGGTVVVIIWRRYIRN